MAHEVAPAVFVIHEVAAVRVAIQGATQRSTQLSDRFCNRLLIEGVHVRSDRTQKGSLIMV